MLSPDHKTIFVHIPKTAGQSIEAIFLEACGLTWEERAPLLLRYNKRRRKGPERLAHLFAREYTELGYVSGEDFRNFFKFAIVRNPYDRALSEFNYYNHRKDDGSENIRDFISKVKNDSYTDHWRHICPQHFYVTEANSDRIIVDRIIRFEDLAQGWSEVSKTVFGESRDLPHRNKSNKRITKGEISPEDKAFVAEWYKDDFRLFGYDP